MNNRIKTIWYVLITAALLFFATQKGLEQWRRTRPWEFTIAPPKTPIVEDVKATR